MNTTLSKASMNRKVKEELASRHSLLDLLEIMLRMYTAAEKKLGISVGCKGGRGGHVGKGLTF